MKILLIGCGHMGGAMLAGWLGRRDVTRIDVVDPSAANHPDDRVHTHPSLPDQTGSDHGPDMVVLAVKPQIIDQVMDGLASVLPSSVPVLSIAAGVTLARMAAHLGDRPLIRAMPNTPGAIGQGVTAYIQNGKADNNQMDVCVSLLSTLGKVVPLPTESMMDAVTAVSGSGPAYLFAFTEALEKAALKAGLPAELAATLARDTVTGAASLMSAKPLESAENLRLAVTSPGGTTEAALNVLHENRALEKLVEEAVAAAARRSQALG